MNRKFRSRLDALQRANPVWICLSCGQEVSEKPGADGKGKKLLPCGLCGGEFHRFPSGSEARRYKSLVLERDCGLITDLELQPSFPVVINGSKVTTYRADFKYKRNGMEVIEDVKGSRKAVTDVFKLKKKLVEAVYAISITVVEWK